MEEGGGEVVRVAGRVPVPAVGQIALDDQRELRVGQQAARQPVEHRGEARDRRRDQQSAGLQHPMRLAQRRATFVTRGQVVQRSQQQHRVGRAVPAFQLARIPHRNAGERVLGLRLRCALGLGDVQRDRIDQVHLVSERGQPAGVHPGAAADVQHHLRGRRQEAFDDLLGARQLQGSRALGQPLGLGDLLVVREDLGR